MDCLHQFGTYLVTPKMVEILCYRRSDSFFDFHLNPLAEVLVPNGQQCPFAFAKIPTKSCELAN